MSVLAPGARLALSVAGVGPACFGVPGAAREHLLQRHEATGGPGSARPEGGCALRPAVRRWAQPSLTHLRQLMREVYDRPSLAAAKGRAARHRMVQRYAPAVVAAQVAQRLREIEDALRRKKHG